MHGPEVSRAIRSRLPAMAWAVGLALVPGAAHAQSLGDRYWVELSGFWPDLDSHVRVNSKDHPNIGTEIDLEGDLALADRKVLPAINAGVRLGRLVVGAEYYTLNREGSRSIARDITFDDVTYRAGASVTSGFDSDIYRLTLGYNIVRNDRVEFGLALGGHVTEFRMSLQGEGAIEGGPSLQTRVRRHTVLAPLPTIGAYGSVTLLPRLSLSGRADWLSLKIDDYRGRLWNVQAQLNYRLLRNVGIALAYRFVDYRLDIDKQHWSGNVRYRFNGPALSLRIGFP